MDTPLKIKYPDTVRWALRHAGIANPALKLQFEIQFATLFYERQY